MYGSKLNVLGWAGGVGEVAGCLVATTLWFGLGVGMSCLG